MKKKVSFLIVDDQAIIRESLSERLRLMYDNVEIAEASSGRECIVLLEEIEPNIIFIDISMPGLNGIEVTTLITSIYPTQKIIAFSMNDNYEMLNKMFEAGAKGYILKTDDVADYEAAIKTILDGNIFISKNVIKD